MLASCLLKLQEPDHYFITQSVRRWWYLIESSKRIRWWSDVLLIDSRSQSLKDCNHDIITPKSPGIEIDESGRGRGIADTDN